MFEMHADNRYMYIFKYRGCRFEMAAGPVGLKCLQTGPSEYPEAPGMLPGREGLIVKEPGKGLQVQNVCRQSLHVHIQAQRLQVRNGCRACKFEMPAGSKWLLQVQQRLQRRQVQPPIHIQVHLEEHQQGHRHAQTLREQQHRPSFCWRVTMSTCRCFHALAPQCLQLLRCTCTTWMVR